MKKVRFLSALMAVCMMLSLLPVSALAAEAEHTPTCGYVCTHEHDEGCGYYVHSTQTEPCGHTDDCGYVAADVYGVCDCAAEADDEGTLVHSDACASLSVVTPAAPCTHADGDETEVTSEDADACTHTCGDDEWVCAEECTSGEKINASATIELAAVVTKDVYVWGYNQTKSTYISSLNNMISLTYEEGNNESLILAATTAQKTQKALETLQNENAYYYIQRAVVGRNGAVAIYFAVRTVGDITVTATNGAVSYKTSAMSEAAPYTAPVANDTAMTFYFTPEDGHELESAELFQNKIELTEENDGSYSYTIGDNYLYNALTFTVSFIEKPAEVEALTLDMNNGSVSVEKSGENLLVDQNGTRYTLTGGALTLTGTMDWGNQMPKSDVVTIGSGVELDLTTDQLTITGYWAREHIITIGENAIINWALQGETTLFGATASAVRLAAGADVTIEGGTLTATNDGQDYAAISVPQDATLTIDGATVNAKGGGAGIGSDTNHLSAPSETRAGTIEIVNGASVTAKGGTGAAAIGGGEYSNGGSIHIGAGCTVDAAAGGNGPAAIGGGERASDGRNGGKAGTIAIDAGATVTAKNASGGSAIGRGLCTVNGEMVSDSMGSITISKGANVTAYALGHDNYTGDHGKPYYFAIDAGIKNDGDAPILNARFDKNALPRKASTVIKDENGYPIGSIPYFNNLAVAGNGEEILFELPAASPISAFAATVSAAGDYMVANAAEGKALERAQYLLEGEDSQFLFTVGEGMTTRDQLKFAAFSITAAAGDNGSISDVGEATVSPLGNKTYTFTPNDSYVVDTVTVDGVATEVAGNTYTFEKAAAHHTIAVTFKTAPVTPPVNPGTTTYTVTVKYVDESGKTLAPAYTTSKSAGSGYDVSAQAVKAIEGYAIDRVDGAVEGTLRRDVTVTVNYKAAKTDSDKPETEIPEEEPPLTDLPEVDIPGEDTPLAPLPETDDTVKPEGEDGVVIVDPETPMGSLPQTGTTRSVDPAVTLGLLALTGSLALAGLMVAMKKHKDGETVE